MEHIADASNVGLFTPISEKWTVHTPGNNGGALFGTTSAEPATGRVYVVGQMVKPGEFALSGRMTVLKALALAGGFKEFARPENIVIVREDQTVIPFNYKRVADGKDASQNVLLLAGDTIVVP